MLDMFVDYSENRAPFPDPGNYVQYTEHDEFAITPMAASSTQPNTAIQAIEGQPRAEPFPKLLCRVCLFCILMALTIIESHSWVVEIAPTMTSAGLIVMMQDSIQVRRSLLMQVNKLHLLSVVDVPEGLNNAADRYCKRHLEGLVEG